MKERRPDGERGEGGVAGEWAHDEHVIARPAAGRWACGRERATAGQRAGDVTAGTIPGVAAGVGVIGVGAVLASTRPARSDHHQATAAKKATTIRRRTMRVSGARREIICENG